MTSDLEFGWACGLFEGEGTATVVKNGGRTGRHLVVAMTDLDVLERFQTIVGVGKVRGPYSPPSRKGNKPMYIWGVSKAPDIDDLALLLYPMMSARRQAQLDAVLACPPPPVRMSNDRKEELRALYDALGPKRPRGSVSALAADYGISVAYLHDIVGRHRS